MKATILAIIFATILFSAVFANEFRRKDEDEERKKKYYVRSSSNSSS